MSILDSVGTTLTTANQRVIHGVTITFSSYTVVNSDDGAVKGVESEHEDEDGKLMTKIVHQRRQMVKFTLKSHAGALPLSDFPKHNFCAIAGLSRYWVDDCGVSKSKDPEIVTATLDAIIITRP